MVDEERTFTVTRVTVHSTCEVNLQPEDYDGKTEEEIIEYVRECSIDSDMWKVNESEENDEYQVEED